MSEQYTISAVGEQTRDYGDKRVYYVRLREAQAETPNQAFELHQKQTSRAPEAGQTIDVKTFDRGSFEGQPYVKIIKDWDAIKARSSSNSTSGGGGPKDYQRSPDHPLNMARTVHAAVLGSTPDYIEQMLTVGVVGQPKDADAYWALVDAVAARLRATYPEAIRAWALGDAAVQTAVNGAQQEIPADTAGLIQAGVADGVASKTADEDIPF